MKISLEWLTEFITWVETDPKAIAERLTLSTAEVEDIQIQGELLEHCVVGKITALKKHPDADRLSIAEVQTEQGTKTVVCGGTNLREGMQVAFAHIGATVEWHGTERVTLKPTKIRGIESSGMICAAEELGLKDLFPAKKEDGERAIVDLTDKGFETGAPLREALGLTDTVLHVNNTSITARPDLFSHLGFARECVALGLATWKEKPSYKVPRSSSKAASLPMKIECPEKMPRYLACLLNIEGLGETPEWMKRRLIATGWRPVSLPVDITNYVTMELGVPLHSFDADDIEGTVHVRLSKKGEKVTTLDKTELVLPEGALVLSDDKGIFDLLGIMGGLRSSTKPATKKIYLHAAALDPSTIRRTVLATGHRTDAATVYEKGVPFLSTEQGFVRALELFLKLVPGATVASAIENQGTNGAAPTIAISLDSLRAFLGMEIAEAEVTRILTDLECIVRKNRIKGEIAVSPPLHRLRDLTGTHDILEEVGRIYGFENITPAMPAASLHIPVLEHRLHTMRDTLKARGFYEIVPLSFVSPALLQDSALPVEDAIAIQNPLGAETSLLQTSTLPALLKHAQGELPMAERSLHTFHAAHVFRKGQPEHAEMGLLIAAREETDLLHDPFLVLRQTLLHCAESIGYELTAQPMQSPPPLAHPGRAAKLYLGKKEIGQLFEIHPSVRARFDLPHRAAAATIHLSELFASPTPTVLLRPIPVFPAVVYDETVERKFSEPQQDLLQKIRAGSPLLENVSVQDVYRNAKSTDDRYKLTLRFTYRAPDRTLTEEEAKKAHVAVLAGANLTAM